MVTIFALERDSTQYWREIAEKRRRALIETLRENETVCDAVDCMICVKIYIKKDTRSYKKANVEICKAEITNKYIL